MIFRRLEAEISSPRQSIISLFGIPHHLFGTVPRPGDRFQPPALRPFAELRPRQAFHRSSHVPFVPQIGFLQVFESNVRLPSLDLYLRGRVRRPLGLDARIPLRPPLELLLLSFLLLLVVRRLGHHGLLHAREFGDGQVRGMPRERVVLRLSRRTGGGGGGGTAAAGSRRRRPPPVV